MSDIILALKPKWANLILEGKKSAEVRRVLPKDLSPSDKCYLYCRGSILGYAVVKNIITITPNDALEVISFSDIFSEYTCLEADDMGHYLFGGKRPGMIIFESVHKYDKPEPYEGAYPQNFIYVDKQSKPKQTELNL